MSKTIIRLNPGHHPAGCYPGIQNPRCHNSLLLAIEYRLSCFWETVTGKRKAKEEG